MPIVISALLSRVNWKAIWIGLGLLVSAFLMWTYLDTRQENVDLRAAVSASEREIETLRTEARADNVSIASRNELLKSLATMEVNERAETIKALEANPNWAKQPIPADVLKRLRP